MDKRKKERDPVVAAHEEAEKDMSKDAEMSDSDPADDLDEGELARKDNSAEAGFDSLERPGKQGNGGDRGRGSGGHSGKSQDGHSGKGKEK